MKQRSTAVLTVSMFRYLVVVLLASCGGGDGGSTPPQATSTVLTTACIGTIAAIVDAVDSSSWNPGTDMINVNDVVQWNNLTGVAHTVTSTTVPANGTFNVALANNTSVCLKFTATGVFNYFCSIHPNMTGSITVN
jgi:plastocyanin